MLPPLKPLSPVALATLLTGCLLPNCGGESTAESIGGDGADPLATPLPEPPAFAPDPSKIGTDPSGTGLAGTVAIAGSAGAVSGGSRVTITNLTTGDSVTTTANADGSFANNFVGMSGDFIRVEFETDAGRSPHTTLLYDDEISGEEFPAVELDDCVQLSPDGFGDSGPIVIDNACDDTITIVDVLGVPASVALSFDPELTDSGLPLSPGDSLSIGFETQQSLLVVAQINVDGQVLPYSVVIVP